MLKIYHNPVCSKSRGVLEILNDKGLPFEVINVIEHPLSKNELSILLQKLSMKIQDIIRMDERREPKNFSDEECFVLLLENPNLMQRPILELGEKAIVGRPLEVVEDFINKL